MVATSQKGGIKGDAKIIKVEGKEEKEQEQEVMVRHETAPQKRVTKMRGKCFYLFSP